MKAAEELAQNTGVTMACQVLNVPLSPCRLVTLSPSKVN
jgi:hypothetical protein